MRGFCLIICVLAIAFAIFCFGYCAGTSVNVYAGLPQVVTRPSETVIELEPVAPIETTETTETTEATEATVPETTQEIKPVIMGEPVSIEPIEKPTIATEPPVVLYDVPLNEDLQIHIIETAEVYGIDPAIIMAIIRVESNFNPDNVGDGGHSHGLMQIQPYWHSKRMERLGCPDLYNPYQNVTVGTDYLAEMLRWYNGNIEKALVAYNQGSYQGTVTQYAKSVLAFAEKFMEASGV